MTEDYRAKKPKIPFFLLFNSQKRPSNANFPKLKLADLGHTSSNFPSLNQESKFGSDFQSKSILVSTILWSDSRSRAENWWAYLFPTISHTTIKKGVYIEIDANRLPLLGAADQSILLDNCTLHPSPMNHWPSTKSRFRLYSCVLKTTDWQDSFCATEVSTTVTTAAALIPANKEAQLQLIEQRRSTNCANCCCCYGENPTNFPQPQSSCLFAAE